MKCSWRSILLTALFLGVASACENSRNRDFPNVAFQEYIYLNNPASLDLQSVGGTIFHGGGYSGLIIHRRYANNNSEDFAAYDRACPEHYAQNCGRLELSDDGIFAICPCEDEKYLIFDGAPGDGAELSLVPYRCTFDGSVIYVRN